MNKLLLLILSMSITSCVTVSPEEKPSMLEVKMKCSLINRFKDKIIIMCTPIKE